MATRQLSGDTTVNDLEHISRSLTYSCAHALTYLHTYIVGSGLKKPATSPKLLRIEQNLLLTACIKSYTRVRLPPNLEWPLIEIQGHWFFQCRNNDEIQLSNDSMAAGIISIRSTYSCPRAITYLLTYLHRVTCVFCDWPVISFLTFQRMIYLAFHCLW